MATQAVSSTSISDSFSSILDPSKTTSSESSELLSSEAKKTEAAYQRASKRKSPPPHESLSKRAASIQSEGSAVSDEITSADQAVELLGMALHEAQIKFQLQDFKEAIETIDTILKKPSISALLQSTKRPDIQELHFQLLKVKGLSFFEKERDHMSLENPTTIDAALALLTPLQENKSEDLEIQRALAYCFQRLSLCPRLSHMQHFYLRRADICYEKAQRLSPRDLSIVQDWVHFHLECKHYRKGLYLLNWVRPLLDTCNDASILIPFFLNESQCYDYLSNPALYNPNDKPQKLCDYYQAKAQESLKKAQALMGQKESQSSDSEGTPSTSDLENDK